MSTSQITNATTDAMLTIPRERLAQLEAIEAACKSLIECTPEQDSQRNAEFRSTVAQVFHYLARTDGDGGNAPGHAHAIPGIWDVSNQDKLAGKPCEWCALWRKANTLLSQWPDVSTSFTEIVE